MIRQQDIVSTVESQRNAVIDHTGSYPRNILGDIDLQHTQYADIITGIRRCGKSTLVEQLMQQHADDSFYLNFDTPSLFGFSMEDFKTLDSIINNTSAGILFFDEIQIVDGWETYVRSLLDAHKKVVVTGSNASMLSRELGTRMTGRHISHRLMPFSYCEYLGYLNKTPNKKSLLQYLDDGGFPAYLQTGREELLSDLAIDILYRDIIVRYGLRDEQSLKSLMLHLAGNVGNLVSGGKLTQVIRAKAPKTVLDYISYMENAYLLFTVPLFTYSFRSQVVNPKKIYCVDMGLQRVLSPSFSDDIGRRLENLVFIGLLQKQREIYYYNSNGRECDFVVCHNGQPETLIQVCCEVSPDNQDREYNGIIEAMKSTGLNSGLILTLDQTDLTHTDGLEIRTLPIWQWMTEDL